MSQQHGPGRWPLIPPNAESVEGNAKLQGSEVAARIGGPGLAGLVTEAFGVAVALLFNGLSFLASAACLLGIRPGESRPRPAARRAGLGREIVEGLRFVVRDPYLRPLAMFAAVGNFALTGYQALLVVFLVRVVGIGAGAIGLLVAAGGAGGLLGALAAGRVSGAAQRVACCSARCAGCRPGC